MFYAHSTENKDKADWHRLSDHLKKVGERAEEFASPMGKEVASMARAAGLLHDLGKYTKEFQQKLSGEEYRNIDHSTHGAKKALKRYERIGHLIAYTIAGHHCGLSDGSGEGKKRKVLSDRLEKKDLPELCSDWEKEIQLPNELSLPKSFNWREKYKFFQFAFLIRMIFSCLVDADFLDTEEFFFKSKNEKLKRGFDKGIIEKLSKKLDEYLSKLEEEGKGKHRDSNIIKYRREILHSVNEKINKEQGLFSLTVPTGGGKTLSSLSFALKHALKHGMKRVIYVAPFMSIIEQNATVFRKVFEGLGDAVVLEHHSSFMEKEMKESPDQYQSSAKLKLAMENWDCPVVATTAVQFFESLFSGRPSQCRKLHNIANSVVILDEAQALPLHVLRPCIESLKELSLNYHTSVILCTATQPALLEEDGFEDGFKNVNELASEPEEMFKRFKRVTAKYIGELKDNELVEEIATQNQVLCIVNIRFQARELFKEIKKKFPEEKGIFHLSTAMCARHRSTVLEEIREQLKKGLPCRLVATSLIEAGVDIDFPIVFREETGLDSVVQAAGRCNREGKRPSEKSLVKIFRFDFSKRKNIPIQTKQCADRTQRIFKKFQDDPIGLEAIKEYFKALFWQKELGDETELDAKSILKDLSKRDLESIPFETVEKNFRMIHNEYQRPVIINYKNEIDDILNKLEHTQYAASSAARKLQPYIAQVPRTVYNALSSARHLRLVAKEKFWDQFTLLESEHLYSDEYGLDWDDPSYIDAERSIIS